MKYAKMPVLSLASLLLVLIGFSGVVNAQNATLTATPPQLTFNTSSGTTPPTQTLTITSSAGATPLTISAFSSNGWLTVTPSSGTTPLQLTVSVNPSLSTLSTDNGFLNISGGGGFLSVRVELDVNSPAPSAISANPNALSFTFSANSTVPQTESVMLSSSNTSVSAFTATAVTNNGGNWLTVTPTTGSLPGSIQVTANPTALTGSGPFKAAVAINAPGTTGISIPVLVTIAGTPAIQVMPAQLSFAWQIGTNAPAAQEIAIASSTGANVSFTASATTSSCGNWLVVTPQSGVTPGNITAQIDTSGLTTAQTCTGQINISAPSASNPSVEIPVSLLVSTNPLLLAPATGPAFTYQIGTNTQLAAQNVQVTSSSTALNFTATVAPTTAGGPSFLTVTPATGTTPQSLQLQVTPSVLAILGPGTYSDTVTLTSSGAGNSPVTFPVTLTVNSSALLQANAQSLTFNYEVGQTTPPQNQVVTVSSTGAPQTFEVSVQTSNCSGFLSATPTSGLTLGNANQNMVTVSVNTAKLTPQVCKGDIILSVPNSSTPALDIPVTLNVSSKPLLNIGTNNISLTELVGAAVTTQAVAVTSTDSATVLPFTATAVTNPVGLTWLSVAPNTGNTPSNLQVAINPANLGVGTYTGTVTVSSPGLPSQVINVQLVIVSSIAMGVPPSITLSQTPGGGAVSQTVQISGVPTGATIGALTTTLNGSGWLTATTSGSSVMVSANATNLTTGTYSGVVTVIVPGAGGSPLYIAVTFNVGTAGLTLSSTTAPFTFQIGGTIPAAQSVQVSTSNGSNVSFTATFTPATGTSTPANLVTVSPANGTTPASLSISLNSTVLATLGAGTYSGNIVVSSPSFPGGDQSISVTLTVSAATAPGITAFVNAASFLAGPISPGELISIFGSNLGPTQGLLFTPDNGKIDTTLDDTKVTFNGVAAPLIYTSSGQINAIVPYEIGMTENPLAQVNVVVTHSGSVSATTTAQVAATAPGIFSANETGNGQGAILNENLSGNSSTNPAPKGSIIAIYATGEGLLTPQPGDGVISGPSLPLPKPNAKVSVTIGGQPATISYAGEAPGLVSGVLQVNAQIPASVGSGNQIVTLTIGDNTNTKQSVTVAVQ